MLTVYAIQRLVATPSAVRRGAAIIAAIAAGARVHRRGDTPSVLSNRFSTSTNYAVRGRTANDFIFVERFSAPGGPEVNSLGYLDIMAEEKSVYNAMPFRNSTVLGSGSGEAESGSGPGSGMVLVRGARQKRRT